MGAKIAMLRHALALVVLAELRRAAADCDAALARFCGAERGGEATCTACARAPTHAAALRVEGCAPADITGFCTRGIDPRYRKNITVYHINPSSFGDVPLNENTGDLHGDMCASFSRRLFAHEDTAHSQFLWGVL